MTQPVIGILFLIGMILKFTHLPGAGITIFVSLSFAILLLMMTLIQVRGTSLLTLLYKLAIVGGATYIAAVMFKVMHWPGATMMLVVSMPTLGLILVLSALKANKWYYALLSLLFSVTLIMALFKILYWPRPPYLLYGSYFGFLALLSGVCFYRGQSLSNNDSSLSKQFQLLGGIALISLAITFKIKYYPDLFTIGIYPMRILETFSFAAIVTVTHKLLNNKPYSVPIEKDFQFLKTTQGIFLIMLVMMVLVSGN